MPIAIRGLHATCEQAAEQILARGFNPADVRLRAGPGAYFWAYSGDDTLARELAHAWWVYKSGKGEYDRYHPAKRGYAAIHLEWQIEASEFLDLDGVRVSEELVMLERNLAAMGENYTSEQLYGMYLLEAERNARTRGGSYKVAKARMSAAPGFFPKGHPYLTSAVNGYIILPGAISLLNPTNLSKLT